MARHLTHKDENYGFEYVCYLCGIILDNVPEARGKECSARYAETRLADIQTERERLDVQERKIREAMALMPVLAG